MIEHRRRRGVIVLAALALGGCPAPDTGDATPAQPRGIDAASPVKPGVKRAQAVSRSNAACLSYGEWRTTLTSEGPSYPLPVFAPEVERRCVIAYEDNRSDIITILPADALPEETGKPPALGRVPNAGGLSDERDMPGAIVIRAATSLGGQANADAVVARDWAKPATAPGYPSGLEARWRGVTISGALTPAALTAAIGSLGAQWRPVRGGARGNERLEGLSAAANWHHVPDGQHVWTEVGGLDKGDRADIPVLQWEKRGSNVVAYVHVLESDNTACYAGTLDARGRLTRVRFTDPLFGGEGGAPAVKSVGDTFPDHLVKGVIRPASPVARRKIAALGGAGGPKLCRKAFAKPGKMALPGA